jgi:hypothetical protein
VPYAVQRTQDTALLLHTVPYAVESCTAQCTVRHYIVLHDPKHCLAAVNSALCCGELHCTMYCTALHCTTRPETMRRLACPTSALFWSPPPGRRTPPFSRQRNRPRISWNARMRSQGGGLMWRRNEGLMWRGRGKRRKSNVKGGRGAKGVMCLRKKEAKKVMWMEEAGGEGLRHE